MPAPRSTPLGSTSIAAEQGIVNFAQICAPFFAQASQPTWILLAQRHFGERILHSTHISKLVKGDLLYPAPKTFLAIGNLNLAIAEGTLDTTGLNDRLPAGGLQPMVVEGEALGPLSMFAVFSGYQPVDLIDRGPIRTFDRRVIGQTLRSFGRAARARFYAMGIDFVADDRQRLLKAAPCLLPFLTGEPAGDGRELLEQLPAVAELLDLKEAELWEQLQRFEKEALGRRAK
jgi:hypothetical protein